MDPSAALNAHLDDLVCRVEQADGYLSHPLTALADQLRSTIASYLGAEVVIDDLGQLIVWTAFDPSVRALDISASLWLPVLPAPSGRPPGRSGMTFYAGAAGAFVDLAADHTYARQHRRPGRGDPPGAGDADWAPARLDETLVPRTLVSGVTGVTELRTIYRAVGKLIDAGHDRPEDELLRRAAAAGLHTHTYAAQLLQPDEA